MRRGDRRPCKAHPGVYTLPPEIIALRAFAGVRAAGGSIFVAAREAKSMDQPTMAAARAAVRRGPRA